jgi:hypothetical protein
MDQSLQVVQSLLAPVGDHRAVPGLGDGLLRDRNPSPEDVLSLERDQR